MLLSPPLLAGSRPSPVSPQAPVGLNHQNHCELQRGHARGPATWALPCMPGFQFFGFKALREDTLRLSADGAWTEQSDKRSWCMQHKVKGCRLLWSFSCGVNTHLPNQSSTRAE